jgi:long-subunit fatty acid transport protein
MTFGIVVKSPFDASIHHKFNLEQTRTTRSLDNITVRAPPLLDEDDEDVTLRMPLSYGCGLAWRVSDAFSFGFDIYRTDWSGFLLIDSRGNRFSPIDGRPESSSRLKDTTQVRFGGEYLFISGKNRIVVPLRAGIFSDPETSYNDVRRFYGASIGSGVAYKGIIFDAAYQLRWGNNVDTGNLISTSRADIKQHLFLTSLIVHF